MKKVELWEIITGIILALFFSYLCGVLGYSVVHHSVNSSVDLYDFFMKTLIGNPIIVLSEIANKDTKACEFALWGLFISAITILLVYSSKSKKNFRLGEEHGSERFATIKEMKKVIDKKQKNNTIFSQNSALSLNGKKYRRNMNALVIGGSGAGKTRFFLKPNLLQENSSFVVTDPKGEILQSTGDFLKEVGYKIKVFNLAEMNKSDFYNPFHYIRDGFDEDVMTVINTIIVNTSDGKKGNDPFWDNAEKLLLQALFFYILEVGDESEKNMTTVLKLLALIEVRDDDPSFKSPLDYMFDDFEDEYGEHIAIRQYKAFKTAPAKTALSIAITASARLAPFNISTLADITSMDNLELDKIGEEKTAFFIILSATDPTFNFIACMMYTQLFAVLDFRANRVHGGSLPIPVRFFLDEFANIGKIPNFEKILAYARSLNVGIVPIIQSISQLKEMYKDSYETIIDNCDTLLFLGGKGTGTTKNISEMLGNATINHTSVNKSYQRGKSYSFNDNILTRELLKSTEIARLPVDECLVFIKSLYPFKDKKYNYLKHKNYKYTGDFNSEFNYVLRENSEILKEKVLEEMEANGVFELEHEESKYDLLLEEYKEFMKEEGEINENY